MREKPGILGFGSDPERDRREATMNIRLKGWLIAGLLLGPMVSALAEEITLTTYYPSPRGVYQELRVTERMAIGQNAPPQARLHLVQPNAEAAFRVDVGTVTNALVVDAQGEVGIGTGSPGTKLDVQGNVAVFDATAPNHAVALGQFTSSLASPGYQELPGGLIIQWGSVTGVAFNQTDITVNFPTPFPNAAFAAFGQLSYASPADGSIGIVLKSLGTSTAVFFGDHSVATASGTLYWIAIGD